MVRSILAALLVAACSPAAGTSLTFGPGDSGALTLAGGTYRATWSGDGCTYTFVEWAPTHGPAIELARNGGPAGSVDVVLPAGPGYLNRGGDCSLRVTLTRE